MAQYRVRLVRTQEFVITVNAEDEDAAISQARKHAPLPTIRDAGIGQVWSVETSDWQDVEDFHFHDYDPERHGETVEEIPES